jgi:hypothetical protein
MVMTSVNRCGCSRGLNWKSTAEAEIPRLKIRGDSIPPNSGLANSDVRFLNNLDEQYNAGSESWLEVMALSLISAGAHGHRSIGRKALGAGA